MTTPARAANLASLVAIVALSLTAYLTAANDHDGSASGPAAPGTARDPGWTTGAAVDDEPLVAGIVITAPQIGGVGIGDGVGADLDPGTDAGSALALDSGDDGDGPVVLVDDPEAGRRGLEALATMTYPWEEMLPGWRIRFRAASDGAYGYTLPDEQRIEIYLRPGQTDELLTHVLAHELGHAVDVTYNDADDREAWREARDLGGAPWWPDDRAADFATGAGDFAECFAAWQVGAGSFRSELGDPPTPAQTVLLQALSSA